MNIQDSKNIYFIGIGGIGMSALARMFFVRGAEVSGSDIRQSVIVKELQDLGIKICIGHQSGNLTGHPDAVIYSEDISPESLGFVEIQAAQKLNIPRLTYAQALGQLFDQKYGIGVSGTNGKSTTTSMLGLILEHANLDPDVIVGSKLSVVNESEKFKANARVGQGEYFVAEADEYHRHMLEGHPKMIVITNIAEDHLDYYHDLLEIKEAFTQYINSLPADGILIYNADDRNTVEVCRQATCHKYTFGINHYADLQAMNIRIGKNSTAAGSAQFFDLHLNDEMIGSVQLNLPGQFNIANALGAILAALKLNVPIGVIQDTLQTFAGIWRRFELVGNLEGKPVISDYAHHPAGVYNTILAAKEFFPDQKILVVFQPHHRNRTKALFGQFTDSLIGADMVILPEIFDVVGREHGESISSRDIVSELAKKQIPAIFVPTLDDTAQQIRQRIKDFDVVLCMGAGDIDLMARKLVI